jgi:HEPN domain-containing protein
MSSKEEVEILKNRAKSFLEISKICHKKHKFDLPVSNCEQATQLFLKAFLLEKQGWYPKTHSIFELMKLASKFKPKLKNLVKNETLAISLFEDSYITSRYVARIFEKEESEKALKFTKKLGDIIGK